MSSAPSAQLQHSPLPMKAFGRVAKGVGTAVFGTDESGKAITAAETLSHQCLAEQEAHLQEGSATRLLQSDSSRAWLRPRSLQSAQTPWPCCATCWAASG